VVSADLTYRGSVRDFPFRKDEGLFLVRGHVEDALFDYQPGWVPASNVTADLEFRNEGMHIRATSASVGGLHITEATADIADLKETHLRIKAAARGDLQEGLAFLANSPLAAALGEPFARLSGHGAIDAAVDLDLPIRRLENRKIEVTARVADATAAMRDIDAPVRSLQGSLTVRNTLIAAADLHAQWLGGPVEVVIRPNGNNASTLRATGTAAAAQLKPFLPPAVKVSGSTQWRLGTEFYADTAKTERKSGVRIDSDLRGLGIALPEPVGKSESEPRPFQVTLEADGDNAVLARSWLGDVRAIVRVARPAGGGAWSLDRGGLRADGNAPALPNHRGLRIEGTVEKFVLDDWLALRGEDSGDTSDSGKTLSDYLQAANVHVGTFELAGYRWSDVRGVLQSTTAGWRVDVDGPGAAGQVLIPEQFRGSQVLRATLERLVLEKPEATGSGAQPDTSDPRNLPNLLIHVGELRFANRTLGTFDLRATRQPDGIRFENASVHGASAHAEGQGEWIVTPQGQQSSLKATVTSDDVAATLRALGYSDVLEAKHGEVHGDLKWPGGFDAKMLDRAAGSISVKAETGQLTAVQPGAGRVLGLFSVAALPRRLALDFKDLTDKGLAFDKVQGDFELRDGNAFTSNLLLRGPAAEIGIAGRTGIATHDYDQTAVVTGNLGASLPVAGALAGGPVVGAAVLLFSQIFKEPLKGVTRGYYRITGPWENPTVERVDASAIKVSEQQGASTGK
jgi:uncharacterized protein (TIGR02099 family)